MFLARDLFRIARELKLSNTATSNLYFANYIAYFGYGDEVRKGILQRILPGLPALMASMTHTDPEPLVPEKVFEEATERLRASRFGRRAERSICPCRSSVGRGKRG